MLVERAQPRPGERVLDACCGTGASARPAARMVGDAGRVDAVDLSGALLDAGRQTAPGMPQLRFIQGDVTGWSPPDGAYDLVQSGFGVFFLSDMDAGSRHLISLLRPDGRFAVQSWREGALADFARCLLEAVAEQVPERAGRPPAGKSAGDRISAVAGMREWLTSLGLTQVQVGESPYMVPLTETLAWDLVRGTGFRELIAACDAETTRRVRDGLLARIAQRGLTALDAGSLIGTGIRPADDPALPRP
jgi:trans-aconitate methyltransferase